MEATLLMKFGKEEHIKLLQSEGHVYCKDLEYFARLEDGNTRGDSLESVVELDFIKNGTLQIKPLNDPNAVWKNLSIKNTQMRKRILNPTGNLYCLSGIKVQIQKDPTTYTLDRRFRSFGNCCLIITDQNAFFERLQNAINNLKIKWCADPIHYVDFAKYKGEKSLFEKDLVYEWQQEYRFFLDSGKREPLEFSIGCLEDISMIYKIGENPSFLVKESAG